MSGENTMSIFTLLKRQAIQVIEWYYATQYKRRQERQHAYVANSFKDCKPINLDNLKFRQILPFSHLASIWTYKDESWNYIKNLTEYRTKMQAGETVRYTDNFCQGDPEKYTLCLENGLLIVDTLPSHDNWLCFFLNNLNLKQYVLSFDIKLDTDFTEIQVAFRYNNLGNRYRFMIKNNTDAVFECVYHGEFYHDLRIFPYKLNHSESKRITVAVLKDRFQFMINKHYIFTIRECRQLVHGTDLGIILWNANDSTPIKCQISNLVLSIVEEEES